MSRWGLIDSTLEGRQKVFFPHWFNGKCETDPDRNKLWRKKLWTTTNPNHQKELREMCAQDLLFYMYGFVNLFRAKGQPQPDPFLPYDFQIECLTKLYACMHGQMPDGNGIQEDCRMKKPRNVGATWMVITLFEHAWHFKDYLHFLLGSRKAEEVDGTTTPVPGKKPIGLWSKLLPKVDFIHMHQPRWLLPFGYRPRTDPFRTKFNIINPERGSLIAGESANPKFSRSQRYYAIGFDEHAHTEHAYDIIGASSEATDCHIWWSSPDGPDTAFSRVCGTLKNQLDIEWWMHPLHSEGMTIDPHTGDRWSPWFEKACEKVGWDTRLIKNEILADETYATGCFYPPPVFDVLDGVGNTTGTVRDPVFQGELDIIDDNGMPKVTRFIEQPSGRWLFWRLDDFRRPERGTRYIIGVDVAAGTQDIGGRGASNSVIAVCDATTGEIVAEFASHGIMPHELAEIAAAAGHWFEGSDHQPAMIIFESNGPGGQFCNPLTKTYNYRNVWMERRKSGTDGYGWHKQRGGDRKGGENAQTPFGLHVTMILSGKFVERSQYCVDEMRSYQHNPSGAPVHSASLNKDDPSGARDNHGDRVISRIVICHVLEKWRLQPPKTQISATYGSLEWCRIQDEKDENRKKRIGYIEV